MELRESAESPTKKEDLKEEEKKEVEKKRKCCKCWIKFTGALKCILNNKFYTFFMTVITVYALFGDDCRFLFFSTSADDVFFGISLGCLTFFFLEILMSSLSKEGYFLGFYFWLDMVATLSLVTDIGWIMDPLAGNDSVNAQDAQ